MNLFRWYGTALTRVLFTLCLLGGAPLALAQTDTSTPAGRWNVNTNGQRMIFRFEPQGSGYSGVRLNDNGSVAEQFELVSWDAAKRTLEFRRAQGSVWQWYRGQIVEGILVARYTGNLNSPTKPTDPLAYKWRLTGWGQDYFTRSLAPMVFDLEILPSGWRARVRIDRSSTSPAGFEGRFKYYALRESCAELLEDDIIIERWNGAALKFTVKNQTFEGVINGRTLAGTLVQAGAPVLQWRGTRAELLTYGFNAKTPAERARWQARTRAQLYHLMMAGNPQPLTREIREVRSSLSPLLGLPAGKRDDNAQLYPQAYTLTELSFRYTLPNPFGGAPIERLAHGYLAKPNNGASGGMRGQTKYPLVLALNGHGGSAWQVLNPGSNLFWYGDAFARQGYMVLAVDISHRPVSDRIFFGTARADRLGYEFDYTTGDDPINGNGPHPSIKPALPPNTPDARYYTDWEEDGERAWDVMRALDYALARPDVDARRVVVTGLSLGGEMTSYVAALDPRVTLAVSAGFSPDLSALKYINSHGCWNWHYADIREYLDASDLFALNAPRPLIIQTGKLDPIYSCYAVPFVGDKQTARRVRAAYGTEAGMFVHYLHTDGHYYRVGDLSPVQPELWVRVPLRIGPFSPSDTAWQTDGTTYSPYPWTVFRYVGEWLGFRYLN